MESIQQRNITAGGEKTIEELVTTVESLSMAIKDLQERVKTLESNNPIYRGYYRGGL
jgi:hypothetical protein